MDKKNNYTYQDKGWDNMKLILDKEMPEKKRRVIPFYWLMSSVAASIVLIFVLRGNFIEGLSNQKINNTLVNILEAEQNDMHPNHLNVKKDREKIENKINDMANSQNFEENQGSQLQDAVSNNFISKTKTHNFSNSKQRETISTKIFNSLKLSSNISKEVISSPAEEISSVIKSNEIHKEPNTAKIDLSTNETFNNILNDRATNPKELANLMIKEDVDKHDSKIKSINHNILNEVTSASTPKHDDFIKNNLLTENIANSISEASAITVLKSEDKGKFAAELGGEYGLPLKTYTLNLGARYQIFKQAKLNAFIGLGGFLSPSDITYSSIFYTKDVNSFLTQNKVNSNIDQIVGARLFTQMNINISKGQRFYTHFKGGLQYVRLVESSENQENKQLGIANVPNSTSRDQATGIGLSNNPLNLFGQIGLGYKINKLGIEIYYGLSQNTLRNSTLQGVNQKLNHGIGSSILLNF